MNSIARIATTLTGLGLCITALAAPPPRFPTAAVWHQDISAAAVHPDSASMIAALDALGGWGLSRLQIDFSLHVVRAAANSPTRVLTERVGYYSPDCEPGGTVLPVPVDATVEGEDGLDCTGGGDCHLLVVQGDRLYEAYYAAALGDMQITALCLAIWELDRVYPPEGRGEHCTSADAAGFPIAPLLFNADEISASLASDATGGGDLGHAIRFTLPNSRIASDPNLGGSSGVLYVRPATHAGGPNGPSGSVPYGARLRLRANFPLDGYNPAARVVLNTFKRYGIVLADGGSVALTAESDRYTATRWTDLNIDSHTFFGTTGAQVVEVTDFEVLDTGPRIPETYDCVRSVLPPALIFADGFEPPP
jgi:serine/threonine-protein kinase